MYVCVCVYIKLNVNPSLYSSLEIMTHNFNNLTHTKGIPHVFNGPSLAPRRSTDGGAAEVLFLRKPWNIVSGTMIYISYHTPHALL